MDATKNQVLPAPPSLIKTLLAGFDAVSNHLGVIVLPILLDLLLWLGPQLRLERLVQNMFEQMLRIPEMNTPETAELIRTSREAWLSVAGQLNLFSLLRGFPVGVPSLMVSRSPTAGPLGAPFTWEVTSLGMLLLLWLALNLVGLLAGGVYFASVAQVSITGKWDGAQLLRDFPWISAQVILLALFIFLLAMVLSIPFSCAMAFFTVTGLNLGQISLLLVGVLLLWLMLPLVFSPHGIFVYRLQVFKSMMKSIRLIRLTLPATGLFLLILMVLSEGLDVLWKVPPEQSWLSLVGVVGHAFVTTALLAASFIYYRDADAWVQQVFKRNQLRST